jgi:putative transposase
MILANQMAMPRIARVVIPDIPHHITQRGNRRQRVFFSDDDRLAYLELLSDFTKAHEVEIWGYCLMDNHVHIIAVPRTVGGLARALGEAHRRYTRMINFRKNWRGYLWQGRFSSCPLDEAHLYAAMRYVEMNPVRANMVEKAEGYRWSSARAHVLGLDDEVLSGGERDAMTMGDWGLFLSEHEDDDVLRKLRKYVRTGRPLGNDAFVEKVEYLTRRIIRRNKPGPKSKR